MSLFGQQRFMMTKPTSQQFNLASMLVNIFNYLKYYFMII